MVIKLFILKTKEYDVSFVSACLQSAGKDRKAYSPLDQADALSIEENETRSENNNRNSTQNKNHNRQVSRLKC